MSLAKSGAKKPNTAEFSECILKDMRNATLMYSERKAVVHRGADTAVPIAHNRINTIVFAAHEPQKPIISFANLHTREEYPRKWFFAHTVKGDVERIWHAMKAEMFCIQ